MSQSIHFAADPVAAVRNTAFHQRQPFTTAELTTMLASSPGIATIDIEQVLSNFDGVVLRGTHWHSLKEVEDIRTSELARLAKKHVAVAPEVAAATLARSSRHRDPVVVEVAASRLRESPDVPRHPNGQFALHRATLPDLAPQLAQGETIALRRGHQGDNIIHTSIARTMIDSAFRIEALRRIDLRSGEPRRPLMSASPVRLEQGVVAVAWTPPIDASRADEISALGWWIWPAADHSALHDPSRLADLRPLPRGAYRGIVRDRDLNNVISLLCATMAHDFANSRTMFNLTTSVGTPDAFFASSSWRSLYQGIRNPVRGKCAACGRDLRDEGSARRGIGPVCVARLTQALGGEARVFEIVDRVESGEAMWTTPLSVADWHKEVYGDSSDE